MSKSSESWRAKARTALLVAAVAVVASLVLFLPAGWPGDWVAGWTFGTTTDVAVPSSCEVITKRGMDASDKASCDDATWSVAGTSGTGTLYGQVRHVVSKGLVDGHIEARVSGEAAYTKPSAMAFGAAVAAVVLLGVSLLVALLCYLRAATLRPGETRFEEQRRREIAALARHHGLGEVSSFHRLGDYGIGGMGVLGMTLFGIAGAAGGAALSIMADETYERYGGVAVAVGIGAFCAYRLYQRWQDQPVIDEGKFAAVCSTGLLVSSSNRNVVFSWMDSTVEGSRDGVTDIGSLTPFTIRRADGYDMRFDDDNWAYYGDLRTQVFDRVRAARGAR